MYATKAIATPKYSSTLAVNDPISNANVGNYKGSIEFWVKLADQIGSGESNTTRGVSCGLLALTTVSNDFNPTTRNASYSSRGDIGNVTDQKPLGTPSVREGNQLYAFINTKGELRVSRLYWAVYWDTTATPTKGKWRGLIFDLDTMTSQVPGGDFERKVPRRDVVVNVTGWKAHEWHHVYIGWDDKIEHTGGNSSLKVVVDGNTGAAPSPVMIDNGKPGDYSVLNAKDPEDGLFINGFFRSQGFLGGYFHFSDTSGLPRVFYPGNATIFGLISHRGTSTSVKPPSTTPSLYSSKTFDSEFTIGESLVLVGPVRWDCYSDDPSNSAINLSLRAFNNSWQQLGGPATSANSEYLPLTLNASYTSRRRMTNGQKLHYQATFNFPTMGVVKDCVTLDSVQVVLIYPYPRFIDFQYPSN